MPDEISLVELEPQDVLVVSGHVAHDGIPAFLGMAFGETMGAMRGTPPAGPPFARYDLCDDGFDIEAGFPVSTPVDASGRAEARTLPGGPAATVMHRGPYESLASVYAAVGAWIGEHGYVVAGAPWESYLDGPEVAEPRTMVTWPCRPA